MTNPRARRCICCFIVFVTVFVVLSLSEIETARAVVIDIMLVYDTTATSWVSANGDMATFSQNAVDRMNQALQNSGLTDHSFRLVHSMSVNYTTSSNGTTDLSPDLVPLQAGTGVFAPVHTARDDFAADLVAMMVDTGSAYGFVGSGYLLSSWTGDPAYGFTVNAIRSVDISHTLTHEVGHNFGAHHSKFQAANPGPNTALDNEYSAGWYFPGISSINYHTIMAYDDDGYGGRYQPAPLFSTPLKSYDGTVAGDIHDGDNTKLIGQTIGTIANYRGNVVNLAAIAISGPAEINENSSATYTATASFSDGSSSDVTNSASWSVSPSAATISGTGLLSAGLVSSDTPVTITVVFRGKIYNRSVIIVNKVDISAPSSFAWNLFLPAILSHSKAESIYPNDTVYYQGKLWQKSDDGIAKPQRSQAISYCEKLSIGNFTNWRLPTKDELKNLVYCSNGHPTPLPDYSICSTDGYSDLYNIPVINTAEFNARDWYYWTSTLSFSGSFTAPWVVDFRDGYAYERWLDTYIYAYVRCIHDIRRQ